jgi:hypothetical protein
MDFTNRHSQSERAHAPAQAATADPVATTGGGKAPKVHVELNQSKLWRVVYGTLLIVGVLLIAAVLVLLYTERPKPESDFVDSSKLQAVFLNTNPNQVYFGNLKSVNSEYFVLTNIYYLQTSSTSGTAAASNGNVSLIKLGCELHQPYDQMMINRDEVTFWENIKDDSQVAKAVATFEKANPNGQKCTTQTSTNSTVQGGASTQNTNSSTTNNSTTNSTTNSSTTPKQ